MLLCSLACGSLTAFDWVGRRGRLERELHSPDAEARSAAVRELAAHPASEVEAWVLAALDDVDEGVRADAAWAAGRLRLVAAAPMLLGWLASEDEYVRASAARALGPIPEPDITDALVRALGDARASVRMAAIDALRMRPADGSVSTERTRGWITALADSDASVREAAAEALALGADEGGPVLFALTAAAGDDAPEVRAAVARSLGALSDTRAGPTLRRLLGDPIAEVRVEAALAIGRVRYDGATPELAALTTALASSEEREVASAAIAALGRVPGADAFSALASAGERAGSGALASMAEAALRERLRSSGDACHEEILEVLRAGEVGQAQWVVALLAVGVLRGLPEASAPIVERMTSGHVPREQALRALGYTAGDVALRSLLVALDDAQRGGTSLDAPLAGLSTYFDVEGADGRAADPLLACLERASEPADRERVLALLAATRSARSAELLLRELDVATFSSVRRALLTALAAVPLGTLGPTAIASVLPRLRSHAPQERRAAADVIAAHGDRAALDALLEAFAEEASIDRVLLARTIATLARRIAPDDASVASALARRIDSPDAPLADGSIDALARLGSTVALDALLEARRRGVDAQRDATITLALGRFDQPAALEALRALLASDPPRAVLAAAAATVGERGDVSDAALILDRFESLPWPASASASFSLARMARRGVLDASIAERLCALGARHDPIVRANVAVAMAAIGARCPDIEPAAWLDRPHAPIVRSAAARWAMAIGDELALRRCIDRLPPPSVVHACTEPALSPLSATLELRAVDADGSGLPATDVALILADGSVALLRTDANANLFLASAPAGDAILEAPQNLPLEP